MPEPGITDRNFTRPTTNPLRGTIGRRPGGRWRQRLQIPREYADVQLEDGRQAIDVLGEGFFEVEDGPTEDDRGIDNPWLDHLDLLPGTSKPRQTPATPARQRHGKGREGRSGGSEGGEVRE